MPEHSEDQAVSGISPLTGEHTTFTYNGFQEGFEDVPGVHLWTDQAGGSTYATNSLVEAQFPDE